MCVMRVSLSVKSLQSACLSFAGVEEDATVIVVGEGGRRRPRDCPSSRAITVMDARQVL